MNSKDKEERFEDLDQLFDFLSDKEGAVVFYDEDEKIYKQGQPDNRIYRVKSGGVAQSKRNSQGELMTYQILGPGAIMSTYNLSSPVINQPCMAKALVSTELQQVLRESFKGYLMENPILAIKISDLISEELQNRDRTLERQIYMSAKERIYSILKDLAEISKDVKKGKLIDFLTRRELADMAGMTEETATRSISKLEEEGKIERSGQGLIIL